MPRINDSDSPVFDVMSEVPDVHITLSPGISNNNSFAIAWAKAVLPTPPHPVKSIPRGGLVGAKSSGCCKDGIITSMAR